MKDSPILILDEATSAIDIESEIYIKNSLIYFMKYRTVIIIAHRKNTIKNIKYIYLLEKGNLKKYKKSIFIKKC